MNIKGGTFSIGSAGNAFIFQCLKKSLARAAKERKIRVSTEFLKYMGLLPADYGFHYVIHILNEENDSLGLGSGESSGSKLMPTTWYDVWEQFSKTKCPQAKPLVDSECPNPLEQTIKNCFQFFKLPKTYCDIFTEGFGNRVRIIIRFTENVGCQFWWAMRPLNDDDGLTTFHQIDDYKQFFQRGYFVGESFTFSQTDFTFSQFDHSQMLSSLNSIFIQNPMLAQTLDIEETLLTDHPWTESMLEKAKFAICLGNILMSETAKPQGIYNFSEG